MRQIPKRMLNNRQLKRRPRATTMSICARSSGPNGLETTITTIFVYFKIRTFLSRHQKNCGTRGTASRPMARKRVIGLIGAAVLLAATWGLKERVLNAPSSSTDRQSSRREDSPTEANVQRDERALTPSTRSAPGEISDNVASHIPLVLSKSPGSSSGNTSSAGSASRYEAIGSSPDSTDEMEPSAVIGRPFRVSKSIENDCKWMLQQGSSEACDDTHEFLKEMAEEPRDPNWANRMEKQLRHYVATETPGFDIRALECRESRCALEVASVMGLFHGNFAYDTPMGRQLSLEHDLFAYERDLSGARITVTLLPYSRRR